MRLFQPFDSAMKNQRPVSPRSRTTATLLLAACLATPTFAAPRETDWTYFEGTGNWYKAVGETDRVTNNLWTWEEAQADAISRGAHLVDIHSAAENAFVQDLAIRNDKWHGHWIGLYQPPKSPEPDGGWQWTTGAPVTYLNWGAAPGNEPEPNNNGGEDYAQLQGHNPDYSPDKWNDLHNNYGGGYVLERTGGVPSNPILMPRPNDPGTQIYELGIEADRIVSAGIGYNLDIAFEGTLLDEIPYSDIEDYTVTWSGSFPGQTSIGIEANTGGFVDTALSLLEPLDVAVPGTPSYEIKAGPGFTFGAFADVYEIDGQWYLDVEAGAGVGFPVSVNLGLVPGIGVLDAVLPDEIYDQIIDIGIEASSDGLALTSLPVDLSQTPGPGKHEIGIRFSRYRLLTLDVDTSVFLRKADASYDGLVISEASLYESAWDLLPIDVPQLISDTGIVGFTDDGLTMQTGSPVWTSLLVDVEQDSNAMNFDFEFLSEDGSEGLLQVYIDGVLVGTIDERFIDGPSSSTVYFDEVLLGETVEVSFRLDSYTEVDSLIDLSNITFGHTELAVPEPSSLMLMGVAGLAMVRRKRRG